MTDQKRPYKMKRRAEQEEETRLRITESAMELHGTVGPARTSISAVAERAGVRRSTVYRHFPDEAALFSACSTHWMALNPPPDLEAWAAIEDPEERFATALDELYAYYERTEGMFDKLLRDAATVPIVDELIAAFRAFLEVTTEALIKGRKSRGNARRRQRAAIGHALAFGTWQDLCRTQGLGGRRAAELMGRLVAAAG
jgi:AcrR family transcriptional regulator